MNETISREEFMELEPHYSHQTATKGLNLMVPGTLGEATKPTPTHGSLPAKNLSFTLGPLGNDMKARGQLMNCYDAFFEQAKKINENNADDKPTVLTLTPFSVGSGNIPKSEAANIAVQRASEFLGSVPNPDDYRIVFVCFDGMKSVPPDSESLEAYKNSLGQLKKFKGNMSCMPGKLHNVDAHLALVASGSQTHKAFMDNLKQENASFAERKINVTTGERANREQKVSQKATTLLTDAPKASVSDVSLTGKRITTDKMPHENLPPGLVPFSHPPESDNAAKVQALGRALDAIFNAANSGLILDEATLKELDAIDLSLYDAIQSAGMKYLNPEYDVDRLLHKRAKIIDPSLSPIHIKALMIVQAYSYLRKEKKKANPTLQQVEEVIQKNLARDLEAQMNRIAIHTERLTGALPENLKSESIKAKSQQNAKINLGEWMNQIKGAKETIKQLDILSKQTKPDAKEVKELIKYLRQCFSGKPRGHPATKTDVVNSWCHMKNAA